MPRSLPPCDPGADWIAPRDTGNPNGPNRESRLCGHRRDVRPGLLGAALGAGPARAPGQGRESPAERAPARRDRAICSRASPSTRVWPRGRGDLARRVRVAGHGGRLLRDRARARSYDGPGPRRGRGDASTGSRATSRAGLRRPALRPGQLPLRPRGRIGGRDGQPARLRASRRAGRCSWSATSPSTLRAVRRLRRPDRSRSPSMPPWRHSTREWQIVLAEERRRAAAGTGVDAVVRAVRRA